MGNVRLFAACVAIWSTTWIAITFQLGTVAPEISVFYRFLLASLLLFAWCAARRLAWGMLYGSLLALAIGLGSGRPLAFVATPAYVGSLLYLSVFGSILAFAGYLTVLQAIGPARAGYIGVMVPVAALLISAAFEGFRFHVLTWAGIALSLAGNVLVLRRTA